MHDDNSGFQGRWVRNEEETDNEFYRVLVENDGEADADFLQEFHPRNGQYLWRLGGGNRVRRLQNFGGGRGGNRDGNRGGNRDGNRGGGGGGGGLKMLNADMALVSDLAGFVDPVSGFATCSPNTDRFSDLPECPPASTRGQVVEYAENNDLWLRDFRDVMVRLVTTPVGNENLTRVEPLAIMEQVVVQDVEPDIFVDASTEQDVNTFNEFAASSASYFVQSFSALILGSALMLL